MKTSRGMYVPSRQSGVIQGMQILTASLGLAEVLLKLSVHNSSEGTCARQQDIEPPSPSCRPLPRNCAALKTTMTGPGCPNPRGVPRTVPCPYRHGWGKHIVLGAWIGNPADTCVQFSNCQVPLSERCEATGSSCSPLSPGQISGASGPTRKRPGRLRSRLRVVSIKPPEIFSGSLALHRAKASLWSRHHRPPWAGGDRLLQCSRTGSRWMSGTPTVSLRTASDTESLVRSSQSRVVYQTSSHRCMRAAQLSNSTISLRSGNSGSCPAVSVYSVQTNPRSPRRRKVSELLQITFSQTSSPAARIPASSMQATGIARACPRQGAASCASRAAELRQMSSTVPIDSITTCSSHRGATRALAADRTALGRHLIPGPQPIQRARHKIRRDSSIALIGGLQY